MPRPFHALQTIITMSIKIIIVGEHIDLSLAGRVYLPFYLNELYIIIAWRIKIKLYRCVSLEHINIFSHLLLRHPDVSTRDVGNSARDL